MSEARSVTSNHLTVRERLNRLRWRGRRLRCVLTGCAVAPNYPACYHCDAPLYPYPDMHMFVEIGKLEPLFHFGHWVRHLTRKLHRKKCQECGKKYWRGYDDYLCSEECFDEWLPF